MGPVINKASLDKCLKYIEIGKQEGKILLGGKALKTKTGGYFLEPTIIDGIKPGSRIDQEEIFGTCSRPAQSKDL